MGKGTARMQMFLPTLVMAVAAVALFLYAWHSGEAKHVTGMKAAVAMTVQVLPLLFFAFVVAGMVQTLLPKEALARWVGAESGTKGIFLGSVAGGLCPGGPYVSMPIAAGLMRAGAGLPTLVAFMTAWSLWAVARLPMEVGIMGWKFTAVRVTCTLLFPPLAGFVAMIFFGGAR